MNSSPSTQGSNILLGVTGASGMPYAVRLARALAQNATLHMVLTKAARVVLSTETGQSPDELTRHAHVLHQPEDIGAAPASGSFPMRAMVVCPCSMNTLAALAAGLGHTLLHRAADVTLKERRPLILVVRETPFNRTHLTNMLALHDAGATILPAMPAFYNRPKSLDDIVDHLVGRILHQLDIPNHLAPAWTGPQA